MYAILRNTIRGAVPRDVRAVFFNQIDAFDRFIARKSPRWRVGRKYREELAYWRKEFAILRQWYDGQIPSWLGVPAPTESQKIKSGKSHAADIVFTLNSVSQNYVKKLGLPANFFAGKRVLDVGCGPLAPSQQFKDAEHHITDALLDRYIASGWPLKEYGMKHTCCHAEHLVYDDDYFDAILSVNALDHVDDFEAVAREIERVLKPGGGLYMELEYHEPRELEPQKLSDEKVITAFSGTTLTRVSDRLRQTGLPGREQDRLVLWHGIKKSRAS